ncbi:MAG: class I SAM-dependent methyltransferase [Actinobacteria bacterium]|nr:class I SAM-dependent methyltransferase [Actinomycetota bacterium]
MTAATRLLAAAQDAPWYRSFLAAVLERVCALPHGSRVLDLGTGPGILLELIARARPDLQLVGTDLDAAMIQRAARRQGLGNTRLIHTHPAQPLPFEQRAFDLVAMCSVLFLQPDPAPLLADALRVLDQRGEVVVLTPTGKGNPRDVLRTLPRGRRGSVRNATLFVWHQATTPAGRRWGNRRPLQSLGDSFDLTYSSEEVMCGMATLERLRTGWSH